MNCFLMRGYALVFYGLKTTKHLKALIYVSLKAEHAINVEFYSQLDNKTGAFKRYWMNGIMQQ